MGEKDRVLGETPKALVGISDYTRPPAFSQGENARISDYTRPLLYI
ncbi:MAG: hypothetical protein LBQ39_07775 [Tannerellaceae bacterium]|jgi:hypothetical protein|nr:hypothetical protein [Tannerellaceae bacterium]